MDYSRCLEDEHTLKYASLDECVEKTRLKAPKWLAWVTVSIFCSLHLLVPITIGFIITTYAVCFRGKHLLELLEIFARTILPTSLYLPVSLPRLFFNPQLEATLSESSLWNSAKEIWYEIFNFKLYFNQSEYVNFRPSVKNKSPLLFVIVPHGVVPLGCFMGVSFMRNFLRAVDGVIFAASVVLRLPVFQLLGGETADRDNIIRVLRSGRNGFIMSGGIAELFLSNRKQDHLYLKKRKGFVKLAKEAGATLVPMYIFGHTRLFDQLATQGGLAMTLSRAIQGSITYFWGHFFLPFPYQTDIHVITGKPLKIDWSDPANTIDHVHALFIQSVKDLYDEHKHAAGYGTTPLVID